MKGHHQPLRGGCYLSPLQEASPVVGEPSIKGGQKGPKGPLGARGQTVWSKLAVIRAKRPQKFPGTFFSSFSPFPPGTSAKNSRGVFHLHPRPPIAHILVNTTVAVNFEGSPGDNVR